MFSKYKKTFLIILSVLLVFSIGYYLRAYFEINKYLPGSPYEIYTSETSNQILNTGPVVDYKDKATRYPVSQILGGLLNPIFGNLYLVYIFGAIVIFFLGKEISGKNFGGFLAFSGFAFAGENLLSYMKTIGSSGLCYVFIFTSLLFLLKYLKNGKVSNLTIFVTSSILALTTYHTGATSLIMILIGMTISIMLSSYNNSNVNFKFSIDKKLVISIIGIFSFYILWLNLFDPSQFVIIKNSFNGTSNYFLFTIFALSILSILTLWIISKIKFLESEYFPFVAVFISGVLIFSKINFFGWILSFGVSNYHVSPTSLNNYFAQAILLHVYILFFLPKLFKKDLDKKDILIRGWVIGLFLILGGLVMEHFFARILDYSFPLTFVLFGLYWCNHKKFRNLIVFTTLILLILSQIIIFNDPFSMRRYYNKDETESVQKIISLDLNGAVASDLRTSSLFSYYGKRDVLFDRENGKTHNLVFYNTDVKKIKDYTKVDYVVLSKNMKYILYGMNFETKPLDEKSFDYYRENFKEVYNDNLMMVYKIR